MTPQTETASDEVTVERRGRVLVITLNRPEARNAVNASMAQAIADAMDELDADHGLSVGVIAAAGKTFCAGMDLKAFLRGERPVVEGRGFAGVAQRPPAKPIIAAVQGHALAGGCELVLACDLVVASEDASFGLPEVKRGLVAVGGGLLRLPQRIPQLIAMELVLTGGVMDARRAYDVGLVNRLVPSQTSPLSEALVLADEIAANAPLSLKASKRIVTESAGWAPESAWERQHAIAREAIESRDAKEGALAFAEKRRPRWLGE